MGVCSQFYCSGRTLIFKELIVVPLTAQYNLVSVIRLTSAMITNSKSISKTNVHLSLLVISSYWLFKYPS